MGGQQSPRTQDNIPNPVKLPQHCPVPSNTAQAEEPNVCRPEAGTGVWGNISFFSALQSLPLGWSSQQGAGVEAGVGLGQPGLWLESTFVRALPAGPVSQTPPGLWVQVGLTVLSLSLSRVRCGLTALTSGDTGLRGDPR